MGTVCYASIQFEGACPKGVNGDDRNLQNSPVRPCPGSGAAGRLRPGNDMEHRFSPAAGPHTARGTGIIFELSV